MFDIIRRNLYPSFEIYTTLHEPRLSEIHTKAKSALVENILSFLKPKKNSFYYTFWMMKLKFVMILLHIYFICYVSLRLV